MVKFVRKFCQSLLTQVGTLGQSLASLSLHPEIHCGACFGVHLSICNTDERGTIGFHFKMPEICSTRYFERLYFALPGFPDNLLRKTVPLVCYIRISLRFWCYAFLQVSTCQNLEKNWGHQKNLGESGDQTFKGSDREKC